jgi:hypothetical protein
LFFAATIVAPKPRIGSPVAATVWPSGQPVLILWGDYL